MSRTRGLGAITGLVILLAGLAACAGNGPTPPPTPGGASPGSIPPATVEPTAPSSPVVIEAEPTPAAITLTVEDGACRYDGPRALPYGAYEVTFVVRDTASTAFGWFVFTLAPGRTLDEARAAIETTGEDDPTPDWITVLTIHPFETTGTAMVARENLRHMGAYTGGPIYILCATPDRILDVFGPIEVAG